MTVSRVFAMPSKNTFTTKPIAQMTGRYEIGKSVDPFANESRAATVTNGLCPDYDTDCHPDALDFLRMFGDNSVDTVFCDPPYSLRQIVEHYKGAGIKVTREHTKSSWRARHLDEIARILRPGGIAFCFGRNSNGVGKGRGFEMKEVLVVSHGGSRNDTICTVEEKTGEANFNETKQGGVK